MSKVNSVCAITGFLAGMAGCLFVSIGGIGDSGAEIDSLDFPAGIDNAGGHGPTESAVQLTEDALRRADFGTFRDRLAQYAKAAAFNDSDALVSEVRLAFSRPLSSATIVETESLLGRLFEIDAHSAVRVVNSVNLSGSGFSSVAGLWAQIDSARAIDALSEIASPYFARQLALSVIDIEGADAIGRIAEESRFLDADGLRIHLALQSAQNDPVGALAGMAELGSWDARYIVSGEIGRIAARIDPSMAVLAAGAIGDPDLKLNYLKAVHEQWALSNVPQFLDYVGALDSNQVHWARVHRRALESAAETMPDMVLEFGRNAGGELGIAVEGEALSAIAMREPASAVAYLESLPEGMRRDELTSHVAVGFARTSPEAALSWVTRMRPYNDAANQAVMATIAARDLLRAIQIEAVSPDTRVGNVAGSVRIPAWFANPMLSDLHDPVGIVNEILGSEEDGIWEDRMLTVAISRWTNEDPDAAFAWMQNATGNVPLNALRAYAERSSIDVEQFISLGDVLSSEDREEWIQIAIANTALTDASRANNIAQRYTHEPFYGRLVANAARIVGRVQGGEIAARSLGASPPEEAVLSVSNLWAQTDPEAAIGWIMSLSDQQAYDNIITEVYASWASSNPRAAAVSARTNLTSEFRESTLAMICRNSSGIADCD